MYAVSRKRTRPHSQMAWQTPDQFGAVLARKGGSRRATQTTQCHIIKSRSHRMGVTAEPFPALSESERFIPPEPESTLESALVIAPATIRKQFIELHDIAAADHYVVGLHRRAQSIHDVEHVFLPFLQPVLCQSAFAHIIFETAALFVGKVRKLHWLGNVLDDHRRPEPGSEPEKQHTSVVVTANGLHQRVVDDLRRSAKTRGEIKAHPAFAEVGSSMRGLPWCTGPG